MTSYQKLNFTQFRQGAVVQFRLLRDERLITGVVDHLTLNGPRSVLCVFSTWWGNDGVKKEFDDLDEGRGVMRQSIHVGHDARVLAHSRGPLVFKDPEVQSAHRRSRIDAARRHARRQGQRVIVDEGLTSAEASAEWLVVEYMEKRPGLFPLQPWESIDYRRCFDALRQAQIVRLHHAPVSEEQQRRPNWDLPTWRDLTQVSIDLKRLQRFLKQNFNRFKDNTRELERKARRSSEEDYAPLRDDWRLDGEDEDAGFETTEPSRPHRLDLGDVDAQCY